MGHFLLHGRDDPTPCAINAVRPWPQKDIVSHKRFEVPVLKNSRPKKWFIYGHVFSKHPGSSHTDFLKKVSYNTLVHLLGKATKVMRQDQRRDKWPSCPFTLLHLLLCNTRSYPVCSISPHSSWSTLSSSSNSLNSTVVHFLGLKCWGNLNTNWVKFWGFLLKLNFK